MSDPLRLPVSEAVLFPGRLTARCIVSDRLETLFRFVSRNSTLEIWSRRPARRISGEGCRGESQSHARWSCREEGSLVNWSSVGSHEPLEWRLAYFEGLRMDANYPTVIEPATAEYVLAVIRDQHRQAAQIDPEVDPAADLSFDSTVEQWREACDLVEWSKLGHAYNEYWKIHCTDDEWRPVLVPASEKRLEGVCELIAMRASRQSVRPASILGTTCSTAGAFLTIRSLLQEAGACADDITPSASIFPFTRRYPRVFLGEISKLAPGALPPVRIRTPVYDMGIWGMVAGLACLTIGLCAWILSSPTISVAAAGGALFLISYGLTWFAARHVLPASVEFGDLKTFRDMARVLSAAIRR